MDTHRDTLAAAATDPVGGTLAQTETAADLAGDHLITPRRRGDREVLRVLLATRHRACAAKVSATNQLQALIVGAAEELRAELRGINSKRQVHRCASRCW